VLAKWAIQAALSLVPASIPRLGEVDLDSRVLVFGGGLTAIVIALLSVASLGTVIRARAGDALLLTSLGTVGERWNQRVRHVMVTAEIAVALVTAPIGHRLLMNDNSKGPRRVEVVGVVEDVRQAALDTPATFDIYIPLRQIHPDGIQPA
jgi:hypothetical protein